MPSKRFYDAHTNFSGRTLAEYYLSPGIRCKFDTIRSRVGDRPFERALDVGCSGNTLLYFLPGVKFRAYCDLAQRPLTQYASPVDGPVCGDVTAMPYRDGAFDLVTALDVLEHVKDDQKAVDELVRVLAPGGLLLITVPHRMKYFTPQDTLVGHYRRYETEQLKAMVTSRGLREVVTFAVYGQMMRVGVLQQANPDVAEEGLNKLRDNYRNDPVFRKFWNLVVRVGAKLMEWDAQFRKLDSAMDVCFVFKKVVTPAARRTTGS
ncbi:MAG: hypothetical protein Kow0069_14040 [Promethearchaeota archaeon]